MNYKVFVACVFLVCLSWLDVKSEVITGRMPICQKKLPSPACPLNLQLVCGTDGITYDNECLLCIAREKTKKNILIKKEGPC
ncbi:serine protease inhibitor Kazal-type 4 isoform X1 [Protopterus annectens]|uniref:serine protease inhibitor Kazal-type 4 isoform X1 n=1 Tax=Protopterus annectens TaxID=7888 RepID=UPI001CFA3988|nr:serine protease inhibitor Kazal-type 4 isoform X1 [Protopterus annectens]